MSTRCVTVSPLPRPRLVSVGTATPRHRYSQEQLATLLGIREGVRRRFFTHGGIETRHLYVTSNGDTLRDETQSELLNRHRCGSLELGKAAIDRCLEAAGVTPEDLDFLCCVTSTGFLMPGLSAMFIRDFGFRPDCQRVDIVGMGCNAALNALNTCASWSAANPGRDALLVCCEINSAIHVKDDRTVTALVNSLFGDGAAAALVSTARPGPAILGHSSHVVSDAWRAISYDWSTVHNKFELYLDKAIPNVLGEHSAAPVSALLERFTLAHDDVSHWLVHAGGTKVISAVRDANQLTPRDMRHATTVLRDCGNMGSPTVLFSYEQLLNEQTIREGDYGVMITMGPGSTIESALLRW